MSENLIKYFEDYNKEDEIELLIKDIKDLNDMILSLKDEISEDDYEYLYEPTIIVSETFLELLNLDINMNNKILLSIKSSYDIALNLIIDYVRNMNDIQYKNIKQIIERLIIKIDKL